MKNINRFFALIPFCAALLSVQSCNKLDPRDQLYTALVTYEVDGSEVRLQLDDDTVLLPNNLKPTLFSGRKVRALVNYSYDDIAEKEKAIQQVKVHAIDSIRTKLPVPDLGELNDKTYGKDKLEIVNDWVTVAEDGYLTLRIRTFRGNSETIHYINLVSKGVKDGVYEYELRHDARGDIYGIESDALMAFDLNNLVPADRSPVKLHITWDGFLEKRDCNFNLTFRKLK